MPQPVERHFKAGQYLFQEGEHSRCIFLIRKGVIGIRKAKGLYQIELGKLNPNEVLGELSFFDRHPRSASAIALSDVEVLELSFESLDQVYDKVPDYLKTIMCSVATRLRKANEQIRRLQTEVVNELSSVQSEDSFSATAALSAAAAAFGASEVDSLDSMRVEGSGQKK